MLDAINSTPLDDDDLHFMDRVLEAWAEWSRGGLTVGKVDSVALYKSEDDGSARGCIQLSDDQFTEVDRVIAKSGSDCRRIIEVHYRWSRNAPMKARYHELCINRHDYASVLASAMTHVFNALMPAIGAWRLTVL